MSGLSGEVVVAGGDGGGIGAATSTRRVEDGCSDSVEDPDVAARNTGDEAIGIAVDGSPKDLTSCVVAPRVGHWSAARGRWWIDDSMKGRMTVGAMVQW